MWNEVAFVIVSACYGSCLNLNRYLRNAACRAAAIVTLSVVFRVRARFTRVRVVFDQILKVFGLNLKVNIKQIV